MSKNKDVVVEEVVIVEECGDDEEGEWELGEDGCWYCVVDEYYEEEMVSPGGNNSTVVNSKTHQLNLSKTNGRPSPRKNLIGSGGNRSTPPSSPKPVQIRAKTEPSQQQRKCLIGSGRETKEKTNPAPLASPTPTKPTQISETSPVKKKIQEKTHKKARKGHSRQKSMDKKSEKTLRSMPDKSKDIKKESKEIGTTPLPTRYGGVSALKMSKAMKSSPSDIIAAHKRDMISSDSMIPTPVLTQSSIRKSSKPLVRGASSSSVASKQIEHRRPSLIDLDNNPDVVFGSLLDDVIERQRTKGLSDEVPTIVEWTIEHLRKHGMTTNGIFRQSGHHGKQLEKQELIDNACSKEILNLDSLDVHTVGALLRSYLRSLPSSVIPRVPFFPLLVQLSAFSDNELRLQSYKSILHCLPPARFRLLKYLTLFLKEVASHSKENLMSVSNLALVFSPSFFGTIDSDVSVRKDQIDPMSMARESKITAMLTEEILKEAEFIFDGAGEPAVAYEATECFQPSNQRHATLLRGDTFVVLNKGVSDITILIGDTTGKIPAMILPTMNKIPFEKAKTREIVSLFGMKAAGKAVARAGVSINISPAPSRKPRSSKKTKSRRFTDVLRFNSNVTKRSSMIISPRG